MDALLDEIQPSNTRVKPTAFVNKSTAVSFTEASSRLLEKGPSYVPPRGRHDAVSAEALVDGSCLSLRNQLYYKDRPSYPTDKDEREEEILRNKYRYQNPTQRPRYEPVKLHLDMEQRGSVSS